MEWTNPRVLEIPGEPRRCFYFRANNSKRSEEGCHRFVKKGSGFRSEGEIERKGFAFGNGDFLGLRAQGFVPCSNNVMACGKIRKREMALVIGDGKMSGFQDNEITLHPGMNIALDGNEFLVVIGIGKRRGARQLHFVPFAIDTGERMDVVREGVAVGDGDFLANAEGEDVGGIVAVLLVKDGSWTGSWGIVVVAGRNVDDDVAKGVAGTGDDVVRIQRIGGVQANAFRLLGKIKRFVFGGSAGKRDFAGDGATGRSGCVKRNRKTRQRQQAHFSYVHRSSFPKLSEGFQVVIGLKTGRGHEKKQAPERRNTCRDCYNKFYWRYRRANPGKSTFASKKAMALWRSAKGASEETGGEGWAEKKASAQLVQRMRGVGEGDDGGRF
jgi:hypothetical protein